MTFQVDKSDSHITLNTENTYVLAGMRTDAEWQVSGWDTLKYSSDRWSDGLAMLGAAGRRWIKNVCYVVSYRCLAISSIAYSRGRNNGQFFNFKLETTNNTKPQISLSVGFLFRGNVTGYHTPCTTRLRGMCRITFYYGGCEVIYILLGNFSFDIHGFYT